MHYVTDQNLIGMDRGKYAATLGDAHEHIVIGLLIRIGLEVGKVDVSSGPYDLFVYAFKKPKGKRIFLRVQVKTIKGGNTGSLTLGGGSRGGVDRTYKSGVKTYTYTTEHNDLIIGIDQKTLDLYIIPTLITQKYFKHSISKNKLTIFKNNWDILLNWNSDMIKKLEKQLSN